MDLVGLPKYNCIDFSLGNTDFQILFTSKFAYTELWGARMHFHLFCECHFLKEGSVLLKTETQEFILEEGDFCFVPLRMTHGIDILQSMAQKISFYVVISQNTKHTNLADTYAWYQRVVSSEDIIICKSLSDVFTKIMRLVQSAETFEALLEMKLKNLFSLAFIELLEQSSEAYLLQVNAKEPGYEEELTLKIEDFLLNHFAPEFTLEDLASYLCLSARQTERLLKRIFGCGFREIKNKKRIEVAKQMLVDTSQPMKDIAETLGYNGYPGFYKAFRARTGRSPEEYRSVYSLK